MPSISIPDIRERDDVHRPFRRHEITFGFGVRILVVVPNNLLIASIPHELLEDVFRVQAGRVVDEETGDRFWRFHL